MTERKIIVQIPDKCTKIYRALATFRCQLEYGHLGDHRGKLDNYPDLYTFPDEGSEDLLHLLNPIDVSIKQED